MTDQHKWILNRAIRANEARVNIHLLCSADACPASAMLTFGIEGENLSDPKLFEKLHDNHEHMKVLVQHTMR